eukprot:6185308-Pleurochrysis_carterae.AAC.3
MGQPRWTAGWIKRARGLQDRVGSTYRERKDDCGIEKRVNKVNGRDGRKRGRREGECACERGRRRPCRCRGKDRGTARCMHPSAGASVTSNKRECDGRPASRKTHK